MVRPSMEYAAAAAVRDPHHVEHTHVLKEAQPRSERCALNDHGRYGAVTLMLEHLGWDTLKLICTMTRLQTLIEIIITKELLLYRIEFYTVISFH